jgi:transcription elongation factor Elf1
MKEWPPLACRKCNADRRSLFKDTIQTITYRCRICGTEHYKDIIDITGTNPRVGGLDI